MVWSCSGSGRTLVLRHRCSRNCERGTFSRTIQPTEPWTLKFRAGFAVVRATCTQVCWKQSFKVRSEIFLRTASKYKPRSLQCTVHQSPVHMKKTKFEADLFLPTTTVPLMMPRDRATMACILNLFYPIRSSANLRDRACPASLYWDQAPHLRARMSGRAAPTQPKPKCSLCFADFLRCAPLETWSISIFCLLETRGSLLLRDFRYKTISCYCSVIYIYHDHPLSTATGTAQPQPIIALP